MLTMVTFISLLVAIYSVGYMHGDPGYWRFFAYIGLFVFSMTMLVSVSNFLLLYVFWEAVGVCSYLLIGFWYEKPAAAAAGKKAFLVNRVGDFGFMLGVFLIWTTYGTLNFHDTPPGPSGWSDATSESAGSDPGRAGGRCVRSSSHRSAGLCRRRHRAGDLPAADARCVRQECAVPAARVVARRDGRPHAGQRADPRGDDGDGRRVHGRALHAACSWPRPTRSWWWRRSARSRRCWPA